MLRSAIQCHAVRSSATQCYEVLGATTHIPYTLGTAQCRDLIEYSTVASKFSKLDSRCAIKLLGGFPETFLALSWTMCRRSTTTGRSIPGQFLDIRELDLQYSTALHSTDICHSSTVRPETLVNSCLCSSMSACSGDLLNSFGSCTVQ